MTNRQEASSPSDHVRRIEVVAEAKTIAGWRKEVVAGQKGSESFSFISDEGSYMPGGEGTAPTPLTYFTAGVALWLLSQVSQVAAKRRLHLQNERVKVIALFREGGSVLGGTQRGTSEGFSIEFSIDSDEPEQNIVELIQLAHGMCFTEYALAHAVPLTYSHRLNGKPLQIDSVSAWPCRPVA